MQASTDVRNAGRRNPSLRPSPRVRPGDAYEPQMVTYTVRGHAWDRFDPAVPKFEKMPPM
jgi:hypothetical protein